MQGISIEDQIDQWLYVKNIGHSGYLVDNMLYITPMNYIYDSEQIFEHDE